MMEKIIISTNSFFDKKKKTNFFFVDVETDHRLEYIMKDHIPTTTTAFQGRRKPNSKQIK